MKESYTEGLAHHGDPESCAGTRKGAGEALTGAHTGGVLSRETTHNQGADAVVQRGRPHTGARQGECTRDPARSKTSSTCGHSMRENREIPCPPRGDGPGGRAGKVDDHKPAMHGHGKSDSSIVPTKPPNKAGSPAAEVAEGRGLTKENGLQQNTRRTQGRNQRVPSALERVRQVAVRDKGERFSALLHHVTVERLREAFLAIRKNAAPGVDGVTWEHYGADLEPRLENLHARVQRGAYRAKPSRRAYIPKPDGRQRPLGIAALEDKIVQRAVTEVLNAIYEADFLGFSYGFRPGRRAHVALDALAIGIRFKKINWVLDADVRSYFDRVSHDWMQRFLEHRIADRRMLALIRKGLKAGVLEHGEWAASEEGTPQGSSISPLLANVYLHYVLVRGRCHSLQGGTARQIPAVRAGTASGQDAPHQVRSLRAPGLSALRRTEETGDVQLPRLHPHVRGDPTGHVPGSSHHHEETADCQTSGGQSGTPAANASTRP
jgi:RNA-directed DNA polymerase